MRDSMNVDIIPDWDEIERVRNSVSLFMKDHNLPANAVSAVTMVVSELVENAIKYGSYGSDAEKIKTSISIEGKLVIVEVKNPIDSMSLPYLRHLDSTIQWIRGYQDPFETYIIKLRQISTKPLQDTESGLGLVRISYEGQSILDFYVNENNILNVSAVYTC